MLGTAIMDRKATSLGMLRAIFSRLESDHNSLQSPPAFPAVHFHTTGHYQVRSCARDCSCRCHFAGSKISLDLKVRPPGSDPIKALLGQLFLGYSGGPIEMASPCSLQSCEAKQRSRFVATYTFPSWFLSVSMTAFC